MPSLSGIVTRFANDDIVYWQLNGNNDRGKPVYAIPIDRKVRWEDKLTEVLTADGRKVISSSYLLSALALVPGSLVWLGTIADWEASAFYPNLPVFDQGAREVLVVHRTPGLPQLPGNVYEAYT